MISRRRFTQAVAATVAATSLPGCASTPTGTRSGTHVSLGPVTQIDAGRLSVGYAEFGPADGPVVVLVHGWPYDPGSFVDAGPLLAQAGYRVIAPYLAGFGPTVFRSADTVRNAQQSAVALDVVALMDALGIDTAILAGFDWGARTVGVIAALWPERCRALVPVSGYLITNLAANLKPLPPSAEYGWWYQYYLATERGVAGYRENRHDFNKLIWKTASPTWSFDEATYERTARSFDNPDHVDVVVHNYRWRLSLAPGEPQYDGFEQKLATGPEITVPTITVASDFDGPNANGNAYRDKFTGRYEHRVLTGVGHNVPQEAPEAFAQAVIDAAHL